MEKDEDKIGPLSRLDLLMDRIRAKSAENEQLASYWEAELARLIELEEQGRDALWRDRMKLRLAPEPGDKGREP